MSTPAPFRAALGERTLFPDLAPRVYANHAGISAPSRAVTAAVNTVLADYARNGAGAFLAWHLQRARLREKLAALVGAQSTDVALVRNTTQGVTDVALCFPWRAGDRVVLFGGEFPTNVTPWQRAAELFDLRIAMLPLADFEASDARGLDALEHTLKQGARLVAVSAVQFQTGLRMPLAEMAALCHAHGAEIFVDAVQACGVVPLEVRALGIDYLATGSHKWLMGLEGAGFLYAHPDRVPALRPHVAGWLSHEEGTRFLMEGTGHLRYDRPIRARIDFVESGVFNTVGCAALEASVDLIAQLGVPAIFAHVQRWNDALEAGLLARGFRSLRATEPSRRSGTLGVLPPAPHEATAVYNALATRGIACAVPDGVLRFAPHWPNALGEVDAVLAAVDEALAAH